MSNPTFEDYCTFQNKHLQDLLRYRKIEVPPGANKTRLVDALMNADLHNDHPITNWVKAPMTKDMAILFCELRDLPCAGENGENMTLTSLREQLQRTIQKSESKTAQDMNEAESEISNKQHGLQSSEKSVTDLVVIADDHEVDDEQTLKHNEVEKWSLAVDDPPISPPGAWPPQLNDDRLSSPKTDDVERTISLAESIREQEKLIKRGQRDKDQAVAKATAEMNARCEVLRQNNTSLEDESKTRTAELDKLRRDLDIVIAERDELRREIGVSTASKTELRHDYATVTSERDQLRRDLDVALAESDRLQRDLNKSTTKIDTSARDSAVLLHERDLLRRDLDIAVAEGNSQRVMIAELEARATTSESWASEWSQRYQAMKQSIAQQEHFHSRSSHRFCSDTIDWPNENPDKPGVLCKWGINTAGGQCIGTAIQQLSTMQKIRWLIMNTGTAHHPIVTAVRLDVFSAQLSSGLNVTSPTGRISALTADQLFVQLSKYGNLDRKSSHLAATLFNIHTAVPNMKARNPPKLKVILALFPNHERPQWPVWFLVQLPFTSASATVVCETPQLKWMTIEDFLSILPNPAMTMNHAQADATAKYSVNAQLMEGIMRALERKAARDIVVCERLRKDQNGAGAEESDQLTEMGHLFVWGAGEQAGSNSFDGSRVEMKERVKTTFEKESGDLEGYYRSL